MKIQPAKSVHVLIALFVLNCAVKAAPAINYSPADFPNVIQVGIGDAEFAPGDNITITSVTGTRDVITTNESYCVEGNYTLSSQDQADLSFFATVPNSGPTPIDSRQTVRITKGSGTFRLIKTVNEDGYLHVSFYSITSGNGFGGVYFGQGNWVLHNKGWSYLDNQSRRSALSQGAGSSSANQALRQPSSSTANQVIYDYLGDPISVPADLDPAYSKEGLIQAIQLAATNAGVTVEQILIDDSEFPFVIGVVTSEKGDENQKLKEQIKKLPDYEYHGSVSGENRSAFNIVPRRAFPPGTEQRINRRLMLRYSIVYDRISRRQ